MREDKSEKLKDKSWRVGGKIIQALTFLDMESMKYTNGEVTIVWKKDLCIHSGNCVRGLGEVFKPKERPWIQPENSDTQSIIEQVKKCPSGALSFYLNSEKT